MNKLVLRAPTVPDGPYSAAVWQNGQWTDLGDATIDQLASRVGVHRQYPLIVVVPPESLVNTRVQATRKQRKEVGTGLAQLVEDQLISDVDEFHWTVGDVDERTAVLHGIERVQLNRLIDELTRVLVRPAAILPFVALMDDRPQLLTWGDDVLVHLGAGQSTLLPASGWTDLLPGLLAQSGLELPLPIALVPTLQPEQSVPGVIWQTMQDPRWFMVLTVAFHGDDWVRHPHNWLTGSYAPSFQWGRARRWILASAFFSTATLIQGCLDHRAAEALVLATQSLSSQTSLQIRSALPSVGRIQNVSELLETQRQRAQSLTPDLALHWLVSTRPDPNWIVLRFDADQARRSADVAVPAAQSIEPWLGALRQRGLTATAERLAGGEAGTQRWRILLTGVGV